MCTLSLLLQSNTTVIIDTVREVLTNYMFMIEVVLNSCLPNLTLFPKRLPFVASSWFLPNSPSLWKTITLFPLLVITTCFWHCSAYIRLFCCSSSSLLIAVKMEKRKKYSGKVQLCRREEFLFHTESFKGKRHSICINHRGEAAGRWPAQTLWTDKAKKSY